MMDEDSAEQTVADISNQPVPTGGVVGVVTETPASTTPSSCSLLIWDSIGWTLFFSGLSLLISPMMLLSASRGG